MTAPTDIRDVLLRVADLHEQWAGYVNRVIHEFRAGISSGGGPGQRNAVSDPTLALVLGRLAGGDPLDQLHDQWIHATTSIDALIGTPIPTRLRWLANDDDSRALRRMVWPHARKLERIIDLARPMSQELAEKIIAEEAALTMEASYCRACRTPEDRLKSALCQACYSQRRRWLDLAETEMADDHAFDQRIQAGVRQGIIFRMASPLWCKDRPRHVHEDDVA